jgi:PTH1 family peptidyl-tRNA hydrolase
VTDDLFLVAGLGNPGPAYAGNRHNVGFMVADLLAERVGGRFKVHKSRAEIVEGRIGGFPGLRVVLAKPMTFMNNSGAPLSVLRDFFKVPPENIVVIHDELDIPFGTLRLKCGGGDNGHNGLRSISRLIGTRDYLRVRFGIGRPPGRQDPADYVLKDFSAAERKELPFLIDRAADAAEAVLGGSLAEAQNVYHAS